MNRFLIKAEKTREENKTTQKSQDCFSREKKIPPVTKTSKKKLRAEPGFSIQQLMVTATNVNLYCTAVSD